ncbi:MAG: Holliday junction branch migration protein RuvA, partial [Bacillota bacterium]|nr:Holliday junction branch migration protein RuvA [Bacillota bacterium]
ILENNGIGYKILTSGSTISNMPEVEEEVMLYIQQIVREDFIGLYGFLTKEELSMFNLLLTINGVGAKASLSLLSISNVNSLKSAIINGDEKLITRAPGIGKKIAQRVILELKDKLKVDSINTSDDFETSDSGNIEGNNAANEALYALISLGYSEREAETALKSIDKNDSVENIIKKCLKVLMN